MSDAIKAIVGEELYAKVVEKLGADKKFDILENYIPKARMDEVITQKNQLKTQVTEISLQLESLKTSAIGNEALTKTIAELQTKNTESETKFKKSLITSAIKFQAQIEKAKDANDILAFVDHSKISLDESGKAIGLDEQLVELKKNKAYLFDITVTTPPSPGPGTNPPGAGSHGRFNPDTASMDDYMAEFNKRKG